MRHTMAWALAVFFVTTWVQAAAAIEEKIILSDATAGDQFGCSVAVLGEGILVGAHMHDDKGKDSGSAAIFYRNRGSGWVETQELTASDGASGDQFGYSVSATASRAIVGAPKDDDGAGNAGSAYIFRLNARTWIQEAKLTASDPGSGDYFGYSVGLSGDYAIVGSRWDDDIADESGAAYIFHRDGTTWSQQAKLKASDAADYDVFGSAVAISGDYAIAGCRGHDVPGMLDVGAAYIFHREGTAWLEVAKLMAGDPAARDVFGYSVAISGDYALVGAPFDNNSGYGVQPGKAYIFHRDEALGWLQVQKLTAADGEVEDCFGRSASILGDRALVGAPQDDDRGADSGSVYRFQLLGDGWKQVGKLKSLHGADGDLFGWSVAASGGGYDAFVGALADDDAGTDAGSVFARGPVDGAADYNLDHQDEIGVFRNGMWFLTYSDDYSSLDLTRAFGSPTAGTDRPEIGEFNCLSGGVPDYRKDLVILRGPQSTWQVSLSQDWGVAPDLSVTFGSTSHKRVPTRYLDTNGDGCSDIAVFRDGCFDLLESPDYGPGFHTVCFGPATDDPLTGDLDGDGKSDLILWRSGSSHYTYSLTSEGYTTTHSVDLGAGEYPLLGDLNGDGLVDLGSYRAAFSTFRFSLSPDFDGLDLIKTHGVSGDVPIVAEVSGDGLSDLGIFRDATARWWFLCSPDWSTTCLSKSFGVAGDIPIFGRPPGWAK